MEDTEINLYAILALIGGICWFINWRANKKKRLELEQYATQKGYIYKGKLTAEEINELPFPKCFEKASVENYIEFLENDWTVIWGDRIKVSHTHAKGRSATTNTRSGFYIFKFNGVKLPEFEVTDKQSPLFSIFGEKSIELKDDKEFSSSFILKGPFETHIKKIFTQKVRREFRKMDKTHLPTRANVRASDLLGFVSAMGLGFGEMSNIGNIQFYGKGKNFMVIGVGHNDLAERKSMFGLANGIAKALFESASCGNSNSLSQFCDPLASDYIASNKSQPTKINNQQAPLNANNLKNEFGEQVNVILPTNNQSAIIKQSIPAKVEENEVAYSSNVVNQSKIGRGNGVLIDNKVESKDTIENQNIAENQKVFTPAEQINWLVGMMSVDNNIHKKELEVIVDYGNKLGLDEARISRIVSQSIKNAQNLHRYLKMAELPYNEELMRALIRVVYADGKIAKEEIEMIKMAAIKMKMQEGKVKELMMDEKRKICG